MPIKMGEKIGTRKHQKLLVDLEILLHKRQISLLGLTSYIINNISVEDTLYHI